MRLLTTYSAYIVAPGTSTKAYSARPGGDVNDVENAVMMKNNAPRFSKAPHPRYLVISVDHLATWNSSAI
jgi:hypothetical protein